MEKTEILKIIDELIRFPKTKEEGKKREQEFNKLYNKLYSEFDLSSHKVYYYDEIRFRRAIVVGYKSALDKVRKEVKPN